jgi:hypothetical protein
MPLGIIIIYFIFSKIRYVCPVAHRRAQPAKAVAGKGLYGLGVFCVFYIIGGKASELGNARVFIGAGDDVSEDFFDFSFRVLA